MSWRSLTIFAVFVEFAHGRFSVVFRLDGALPPKTADWKLVDIASADPTDQPWPSLDAVLGGPDFYSTI